MAYKLKGGWQIWTPCLAARSPDTQCHSFIEGRRGRPFGLFLNLLKDGIYWLWKYLHRMFICSRHSSPSSLAPCSSLCPEPSGHLMAWVVCSPHFQGSSVAVDYALKKKKKNHHTQSVWGFIMAKGGCLRRSGGCIPETGCSSLSFEATELH